MSSFNEYNSSNTYENLTLLIKMIQVNSDSTLLLGLNSTTIFKLLGGGECRLIAISGWNDHWASSIKLPGIPKFHKLGSEQRLVYQHTNTGESANENVIPLIQVSVSTHADITDVT